MSVRPMFPLESVLMPGMVLPLHVFEDRYRTMVRDCMAGEREFGVVLIERGSEVGGGDVRSIVGTVAQIVQAEENDDGRWGVVAVGVRRMRVQRWLDDDPYPRADLTDWPDEIDASDEVDLDDLYRQQVSTLRRVLAMSAELGRPADPTAEVADEPLAGSYHLSVLAPVGPLDRQRLLAADGPRDRLVRLASLLAEESADLEAQLGGA
jgi:Lon protease-like protein